MNKELVFEYLSYDSSTGVISWIKSPSSCVKVGDIVTNLSNEGYVRVTIKGLRCFGHKVAWLFYYGQWPDGFIDHIDGNPANNAILNLRIASRRENGMNLGVPVTNTSGCMGVTWNKSAKRWQASIRVGGRSIYLGCFESIFEAAACRRSSEVHHGFNPNHGLRSSYQKGQAEQGVRP